MTQAESTNCPHCGAPVPGANEGGAGEGEEAAPRFCPSCGRRIEGWKPGARATLGGAAAGGTLPGGEEPTRAIAPSPSLLEAVAASKQAASAPSASAQAAASAPPAGASTSVPVVRPGMLPLVLGLLAAAGAVAALYAMRGKPDGPPPPVVAAPPPPVAPPAPVPPPTKKSGKARRIDAPAIAAPGSGKPDTASAPDKGKPQPKNDAPAAQAGTKTSKPAVASGGLPHKDPKKQDSKSTDVSAAPSGTGSPPGELPMAANETVENEATPMNEAERRAENAARADADSVRFVVRAHLPQVQACYSRAFKESSPGGRVDIGFVINGSGKATKIRTETNTSGAPGLAKCLEQRIAEWDFARPSSGEFELVYPFVFSPGS